MCTFSFLRWRSFTSTPTTQPGVDFVFEVTKIVDFLHLYFLACLDVQCQTDHLKNFHFAFVSLIYMCHCTFLKFPPFFKHFFQVLKHNLSTFCFVVIFVFYQNSKTELQHLLFLTLVGNYGKTMFPKLDHWITTYY